MKNYSIWKDNIELPEFNKLNKDIEVDVLIIGGGMTGINTLYQLSNTYLEVVLVEQNKIGMGVTVNSTGKLTYLQDSLYEKIKKSNDEEKAKDFDFSGDEKKKEAHWGRDKNVRDVLIHLWEWHKLLLRWVKNNRDLKNVKIQFLEEGYSWKTYGAMNKVFWERNQEVSESDALELLKKSHSEVMELLEGFSEAELFEKDVFDWVGGSVLGSYFVSNTSSHYDWAMKKLKAHKKLVLGK